jgi:hypothetical protein
MWRSLNDALHGRAPLARVVWIYGLGVSVAFLLIEPLFTGSPLAHGLYYALGVVVTVLQSVIIWRCSYNAKSPAYGRFLRALIVVGAVAMLLVLYLLWKDPELRSLLSEAGAL